MCQSARLWSDLTLCTSLAADTLHTALGMTTQDPLSICMKLKARTAAGALPAAQEAQPSIM